MDETAQSEPTQPQPAPRPDSTSPKHRAPSPWGRRIVVGVLLAAALVLAFFLLAAAVPRWWSQRVGSAVDGHLWTGGFLGLVIGLSCTLVPLVFIWVGVHKRRSWRVVALWLVLAAIVALPNLATLSIVVGTSNGAHAGERTMDVQAPWFRGGTLVGAICAAILFGCFVFFVLYRLRTPRQIPTGSDTTRT